MSLDFLEILGRRKKIKYHKVGSGQIWPPHLWHRDTPVRRSGHGGFNPHQLPPEYATGEGDGEAWPSVGNSAPPPNQRHSMSCDQLCVWCAIQIHVYFTIICLQDKFSQTRWWMCTKWSERATGDPLEVIKFPWRFQLQDHFSNFRSWIFRSSDMQVVSPSWTQITFVIAALDNS